MQTTEWFKSKTLIVNALTLLIALLAMPNIVDIIGNDNVKWLLMAQSTINIILRFITSTPIAAVGPSEIKSG